TRPPRQPGQLLDLILDESSERADQTTPGAALDDFQQFLELVVGPHLVEIDAGRQHELIGAIDAALAQQLRSLLLDHTFQSLVATWRSLHDLVRSVETGPQLKIRILQLTRQELQRDLAAAATLEDSVLTRLLLEPRPDAPTLLIGDYAFADSAD